MEERSVFRGGDCTMVQKIKDFILKDVQSENETKKTAVTLRISALMLCLYFLTLFAVFCAIRISAQR